MAGTSETQAKALNVSSGLQAMELAESDSRSTMDLLRLRAEQLIELVPRRQPRRDDWPELGDERHDAGI